ncbi:helix-turn-helix domain-containing protein [Chloroflexota bacterium]
MMEKDDKQQLVLTVLEASRLLRISRGSTYSAVRSGRLKAVHFGKRILIPRASIDRLLEEAEDTN